MAQKSLKNIRSSRAWDWGKEVGRKFRNDLPTIRKNIFWKFGKKRESLLENLINDEQANHDSKHQSMVGIRNGSLKIK